MSEGVRPDVPEASQIDENGSIEQWDASEPTETEEEKSGRKLAGYTSGGDHWTYEFEFRGFEEVAVAVEVSPLDGELFASPVVLPLLPRCKGYH